MAMKGVDKKEETQAIQFATESTIPVTVERYHQFPVPKYFHRQSRFWPFAYDTKTPVAKL